MLSPPSAAGAQHAEQCFQTKTQVVAAAAVEHAQSRTGIHINDTVE